MTVSRARTGRGNLSPQQTPTAVRHILLQASATVLLVTLAMILVAGSGVFDSATVELGLEHYAEKPLPWLPDFVPMPLNTVVNCGYVLCACYWCFFIQRARLDGVVKDPDTYFFLVFNVMGCVYGFVQLYRIVMQTVCSAIMDQWYTLPFFMMVYVWAQNVGGQCSWPQFYTLMCVSIVSYCLTLLTPVGFELALACHILLAVSGAYSLYQQHPSRCALRCFVMAIVCCCGFVVLKLLDLHLPGVHWVFSYVSGHFLSKICDVLQFHYASQFFFSFVRKPGQADRGRKTGKLIHCD
ncbi:hypothetical protein ACOMHN_028099 [Nucella lapillus]